MCMYSLGVSVQLLKLSYFSVYASMGTNVQKPIEHFVINLIVFKPLFAICVTWL